MITPITQAAPAEQPLIPRSVLFGNPEKAMAWLSPDGKYVSYLAPSNGVLNVWLAPSDDIQKAKAITKDTGRGIRNYFWAADSQHVLYIQDTKGDENFRLYNYNLQKQQAALLSPESGSRTSVYGVSHRLPNEIIIGNNKRNPQLFDIYKVNLTTNEQQLIFENDEFYSFEFDDDLKLRFAIKQTEDGGEEYHQFKDGKFSLYAKIGIEDRDNTHIAGFDKTGEIMYMADSRGRDTSALVAVNLKTGKSTVLAADARADVDIMTMHPTENTVQAVKVNYDKPSYKILDKSITADFAYLEKLEHGSLQIVSRTLDDQKWMVAYLADNQPVKYYLYDRKTHKAQFLFVNRQELAQYKLASMQPVLIKARDGLTLVSYLTLPVGAEAKKPLPMVLLVHGGPWARDDWGLNSQHQWLANRGYAVLSVNYRGSTGFGKKFLNAGNKQWGKKMHDDLIDAVNWAIKEGIADAQKVAIMGGSYGGYAALAGVTLTPDVFACAVDIVGVSNLISFIKKVPPYWQPLIDSMRQRIGNWDDPKERVALEAVSPVNHAQKIKKPLFIAQGANDPRVNQDESEQIVSAMRKNNIPVLYALYPDEGHGFARPENRQSFYAMAEQFFAQVLGGRAEPIGKDFANANFALNDREKPNAEVAETMIKQAITGK